MTYNIRIGSYKLALLQSVEIKKSVDVLSDTAIIIVPGVVRNKALNVEDKVRIGDKVIIELGYDNNNIKEFEGYLQRIDTDDDTLTFNCEDDMYLTRKPVSDIELNKTTVKKIASYCLSEIGITGLNCTYDITYDKFVIKDANAYDVFKKLQEETGANIYFKDGILNIQPAYIEKGGNIYYDFSKNIENSDLKYRSADDKKYEVTVEGISLGGKKTSVTVGTTGGEKRTIKVANVMDKASLIKRGEEELKHLVFDGYEGSIQGWLIPYVEPTYSAHVRDADYEQKAGTYYVVTVTTSFSENGGVRKIELGQKLS